MRWPRRAITVTLLTLLGGVASTVAGAQSTPRAWTNIALVTANAFNDESNKPLEAPRLIPLTAAEETALVRALRAVPPLPPHPYSGCHARAHLLYQKLDASANHKLVKVWVFAGATLAPALSGMIAFPLPSGESTSWGYHVAAAYTNAAGTVIVIDPLVAAAPVTIDRWMSGFQVVGAAVVTYLPARQYLFNNTEVPPLDTAFRQGFRQHFMSRNVLNGNFYEYTGAAAATHDGARDLATDALAAALTRGDFAGCEWGANVQQPLRLKEAAGGAVPAACRRAADLFGREVARWTAEGL